MTIATAGVLLTTAALFVAWHYDDQRQRFSHRIDFNREIRPILNQNCTACHGGVRQKNGVSFIYREEALGKGKSGRPTVVPGRPGRSELIARVTSPDLESRMPYHAPPLSPEQIASLRQWIEEGAQWQDHWAFVAPKPQLLPDVNTRGWARQPIDRFILARLEKEGVTPSAEADRSALLRRVSFDLTGLPPLPKELEAFLSDESPEAYEKQVERLLASPHYGERWATLWLDLARYADSKGYEQDGLRNVWPYRDWVVDAFNRNVPYDRFVITQFAGDLLPNATVEDRIATAFHRQTPSNDEAGTDDEEFRVAAAMDRVATSWSVLNGVTINCVQCHSHPYDPIRHEEYYKFLAFFNTSRDADAQFDEEPVLHVPKNKADYPQAFQLQREITALSNSVVNAGRAIAADDAQWKLAPIREAITNKTLGLERQWTLFKQQGPALFSELGKLSVEKRRALFKDFLGETEAQVEKVGKSAHEVAPFGIRDGEVRATAQNISAAAVSEFVATSDIPVLTALRIEVLPLEPDTARHSPEEGFRIERTEASVIHPDGREEKITFRSFAPDRNAHLESQLALIGVNAKTRIPGPPSLAEQIRSGGLQATKLFHARWIVGVLEAPVDLAPGSRIKVQLTQNINLAIQVGSVNSTVARRVRLFASGDPRWTALDNDANRRSQIARIEQLYGELAEIATVPVPVMAEQQDAERRQTLQFDRGNFLAKTGSPLEPNTPALFPKLPADAPRNRLTMARWFFTPDQPLTARVAVNRFWEQLFGIGIVETLEDFGSVGEDPSHPELLDWLALHFQNDLKWDMKALLRELVLSATYRQTAQTTAALLEKDPRNRLLARGPRQRLTAEMVRDQALTASGLLTTTVGGPPVMPPLPPGVEVTVGGIGGSEWTTAKGPDRYRRALYTYLKRSKPYPSAMTFDASARDVSLARRIPTNTPLQALVTLNDPVHHEASAALAERLSKEVPSVSSGTTQDALDARLNYGALLVLSRELTPQQMRTLRTLYDDALQETVAFATAEHAALTAVASVLLNLDAAMNR